MSASTDLKQVRGSGPVLGSMQHIVRPVDGEAHRLPSPPLRLYRLVNTDELGGELISSLKGTYIMSHKSIGNSRIM